MTSIAVSMSSKKNDNTDGHVFAKKRVLSSPKDLVLSYYKLHTDFRRAVDSGKYIYIDDLFVFRPIAIILLEQNIDVHAFVPFPKTLR